MAANNESAVLFDQPGPKGRKLISIVNWIAGIIFAIAVVLILMRLHNPPEGENQLSWELWKPALDSEAWTDFYLPGLWATVRATILAVIGAVLFGLDSASDDSSRTPRYASSPVRLWNSPGPCLCCCS